MNAKELWRHPHIFLAGKVEDKMLQAFDGQIKELRNKETLALPDHLVVHLTTGGGWVSIGKAVMDRLRWLNKATNLTVVVSGMAFSMGVPIFLSVPVGQRIITPDSELMVHQVGNEEQALPRTPMEAKDIVMRERQIHHENSMKLNDWMCRIICKATGNKISEVKKWVRYGRYFDAKEAVEYGFASSILR